MYDSIIKSYFKAKDFEVDVLKSIRDMKNNF
jgi:pentatricopeptide repeat protein